MSWDVNGGSAPISSWTKPYDSELGTLPTSSRVGYTLVGWFTAGTGGSKISSSTKVTENVTYYAHWNYATYSITYDMKGHGTAPTSPTSYGINQLPITIPNPTDVSGYTFHGWLPTNTIPIGSTGNKLFTANWDMGVYAIHYNANGGTGTMSDQNVVYGEYVELLPNKFSNYATVTFNGNGGTPTNSSLVSFNSFLGWATSPNGAKQYNNRQ